MRVYSKLELYNDDQENRKMQRCRALVESDQEEDQLKLNQ